MANLMYFLNQMILQNRLKFFGSNGFRRFNKFFPVLLRFWSISSFERLIQPDSSPIPDPTDWIDQFSPVFKTLIYRHNHVPH